MANLGIRRPPEWGVDPTPDKVRILRTFDLFVFWSSLAVGLLVFAAGSLLVLLFGLNLQEAVVASVVGSVVGALLLAGAGVFGAKYGVPTMVSLRPILGKKGSYVPSALNVFQLVGWTSFELYIMGFAAATLTGNFLGPWTIPFFIVVFSFAVVALAIGGPLVVIRTWLEKIAIWLVLISTVIIAYQIFFHPIAPGGIAWDLRCPINFGLSPPAIVCHRGGEGSLLPALDLVIAMPISWWPLVSDYNRFARSRKDALAGTALGYTFANFTFYFLGAAMIFATLSMDAISAIGMLGLGSMALLLILVDEVDNAFADVYSAAVSVQNVRKKTRQLLVIVVATAISLVAAFYLSFTGEKIGGGYESFLLIIGALFVPLLGVLIADFFVIRREKYDISEFYGRAPSLRWRAFAAWVPGIILYYVLSPDLVRVLFPSYQGLPVLVGASIPAFALSALIYIIVSKVCPARTKHAASEGT